MKWENIFKNGFVDAGKKAKLSRASPGSSLVPNTFATQDPFTTGANQKMRKMGVRCPYL